MEAEQRLRRKLAKAEARVGILERMVEDKTRQLFVANRGLLEANHFMEEVLRSMAGALLVVDRDRKITLVNDRLLRMTGYDEEVLIGQHGSVLLPRIGTYRPEGLDTALEEDAVLSTVEGGEVPVTLTHGSIGSGAGHIYVALDARERLENETRLQDAQRKLVEASRVAGMAEVATEIIHNVGNVLSSVRFAVHELRDGGGAGQLGPSLGRVVALLRSAPDLGAFLQSERGTKVLPYLEELVRSAGTRDLERQRILQELDSHVDHAAAVIRAQQDAAKRVVVLEEVEVAALVDQVLLLQRGALRVLTESPCVDVVDLRMETDRHQVLQILTNFVVNALQAMEGAPRRCLTIGVKVHAGQVVFAVSDTGSGMDASTVAKVFRHGFTTKSEGHGFGLHSAANAAAQLGGGVRCRSDGLGCGATFELWLPHSPVPLERIA